MALWAIGLLAVNSAYYYFAEPSFLVFLPLYVFTIFGMLATFLTELLEILIAEIREIRMSSVAQQAMTEINCSMLRHWGGRRKSNAFFFTTPRQHSGRAGFNPRPRFRCAPFRRQARPRRWMWQGMERPDGRPRVSGRALIRARFDFPIATVASQTAL